MQAIKAAKLFYREFHYQELDIARFLADAHGFDNLYRTAGNPQARRTKWFFIKHTLLDIMFLLRRREQIRSYSHIVAMWHSAPAFILLKWLGLIRYERILWFGFAVRSPFWAYLYKFLAKLDPEDTWFVVFTQQEVQDYARQLDIDPSRLLFTTHGDWPQPIDVPEVFGPDPELDLSEPYYFTGGFTNRDYQPVIEAFRKLGERLIIVCSETNDDVIDHDLPENIRVYRDIPFPQFELLLKNSKAVIIPLKHDAGAAGHSVLVRSMRNAKIVIANDFRIMHDYVDKGVDGVLIEDLSRDLAPTIQDLEDNPERFQPIREAAFERFQRKYSQKALEDSMSDLIQDRWIASGAA